MTLVEEQSNVFLSSGVFNDGFFIDIIENKLKVSQEKFKIRKVLMSPAAGKNENFASDVFRAHIQVEVFTTKSLLSVNVIVKVLLTDIAEMKEFSYFAKEKFVYENFLRSFEKIWINRTGEGIQFGPKSIKFETKPFEIIVLEDLRANNYEVVCKRDCLNRAQTKLVLTKLAKYHASSVIYNQKTEKPNLSSNFDHSAVMKLLLELLNPFIDAVRSFGDCDVYADKISKWDKTKLVAKLVNFARPMNCGFQVLNHGDLWLLNMMFKSDIANNPIDVIMIDFPLAFWGSPINDLSFFLFTSVADDIKADYFDEFVEHYHQELTVALMQLSFTHYIPSLQELHDDLFERRFSVCTVMMFMLTVMKYNLDDAVSVGLLLSEIGNSEIMDKVFKNDQFKKAVKTWLPFLNKRGFFDPLMDQNENVEE